MFLIGQINLVRCILLFFTQLIAGIVAAALARALLPGDLNVSTTLNENTSHAQGTILEMILTMQLVFTVFMLAAEKHKGTFIAPIGIGLSLFIAELVGMWFPIPFHPSLPPLLFFAFVARLASSVLTQSRRLLDWRLSQPCTLLRTSCRNPLLPWPSLDLLGWTAGGCDPGRRHPRLG